MIERIVTWSANHKLAIAAIFLLIVGAGVWAIETTPLDAIPDLSENQVIVFTSFPGRSPQVVEAQVTFPLVTALEGLPKVSAVRAQSMFGMSFIYAIFDEGVDPYWARSRVLEKLSTVQSSLPVGAKTELGPDGTGVGHIFWYTLEGDGYDLGTLRAIQDWFVRPQLQSVSGVAEIASVGGYEREYQINLIPAKMQRVGITIDEVSQAVMRANADVGGGVIEINHSEGVVRGQGYLTNANEFGALVIATRNGSPIHLSEIADVTVGAASRRGSLEENGTGEVTGGIVVMRQGENAKAVIDRVKARIAEISPGLPKGVAIRAAYDRSELIEASVQNLEHLLLEEGIIVTIVVMLFLFHLPSALRIVIEIPVSVLIAFLLMRAVGITSNIMSLGGIAIGIGVLVDASIVLLENAHRHLAEAQERKVSEGIDYNYHDVVVRSAIQVARPIFFSILIIVVSFLPVFLLTGQEGRLFRPLAFTKTFSILASALVSITLVPVLMLVLMKGHILSEDRIPISRVSRKLYARVLAWALRWPKTAILTNVIALIIAIPIALNIGSEFMPPLDEGSLLFMPILAPNISLPEATKILQYQDAIIKQYPEVKEVLGKVGRAETATDPAPTSMIETIIMLKPKSEWRPGITKEKIIDDLNRKLQLPGVALGWTQPIINRINMLSTGVRTDLGLKFFGNNLDTLQQIATQAEQLLKPIPGAADVAAERVEGGRFLNIVAKPSAATTYGVSPATINQIIESVIGGVNAGVVVDGRERFPVTVRYQLGYRASPEELRSMLVPIPVPMAGFQNGDLQIGGTGASNVMAPTSTDAASLFRGGLNVGTRFVPLGDLATITLSDGPPMISSENAMLRSIVYLNVRGRDMGSFVREAKDVLKTKLHLPVGYTMDWSGQYEHQQHAAQRLMIVIPLVFILIYILLYFTLFDWKEAGTVMLSVPFALIGGVYLISILGYNWSVAVWVGFIALYGIATETGVVMVVYLHEALDKKLLAADGVSDHTAAPPITLRDVFTATMDGAVLRLRPKLMTVATAMMGLIPILYSTGVGADVMKPIAAPIVGGMLTSAIHVLIITPVIFYLIKKRAWRKGELRVSKIAGWMRH